MRLSEKLAALCAAAALVPTLIASALVYFQVSSDWEARANEQLQSNARVAAGLYEKRLVELRSAAQKLADEIATKAIVSSEEADRDGNAAWKRLQDILPRAQNELGLDFLIVTDPQGRVIARHNDKPQAGESLTGGSDSNPLAERVISEGSQQRSALIASCVIERGERLAILGLDRLAPVEGTDITEALTLEAGAPIFGAGRFVGMVLIGQMLNNYYTARAGASSLQVPLVAEVRRTLFDNDDKDSGALIGFDNRVIASSVPTSEGGRESLLTGAPYDPAKNRIEHGGRSYGVAWQPVKSLDGSQLGAVGIATSVDTFRGTADSARKTMILIAILASLLAGAFGYLYGRSLTMRVASLTEAASRMAVGELSAGVKDPARIKRPWLPGALGRDEISRLAEELDQTRESFRQAIERLRKRGA